MKVRVVSFILMVLLLTSLNACAKAAVHTPTAAVEEPVEVETSTPTEVAVDVTSATAQGQTDAPGHKVLPPGAPVIDGKELLDSRCASCHTLAKVTDTTATAEEWAAIVTRMSAKGANLTEEERSILTLYLAENYKK